MTNTLSSPTQLARILFAGLVVAGNFAAFAQSGAPAGTGTAGTVAQSDPTEAMRNRVFAALEAGEEDEAFDLARKLYRAVPEDPRVVFLMGFVLGERHRFHEAIALLDELAEKNPLVRGQVFGQTAEWMVQAGMWSEAENRFKTILSQVPDSAVAHRHIADLYVRQGRRVEAVTHLDKLCRLGNVKEAELRTMLRLLGPFAGDGASEEFDPVGPLGRSRRLIGLGQWSMALQQIDEAEEESGDLSALRARCFVSLGNRTSLQEWAESGASSAESSPDHWFAMGTFHAGRDEHRQAARCYCRCVLIDQTDHQAYERLGKAFANAGMDGPAAEAASRAAMIKETQDLGAEMASGNNRPTAAFDRLIELLLQLRRPFESLSWRGIRLAYDQSRSSLSTQQARQLLAEIVAKRKELLEAEDADATDQFLTCGVDPDSLVPAEEDGDGRESQ